MISTSCDPSVVTATPACVLGELNIENLLLIERAQLRLLGADTQDATARRHARDLRKVA